MPKIHLEQWQSSQGRTETHWFDDETDEYLFGYNPKVIPEHLTKPIFEYLQSISMTDLLSKKIAK